MSEAVTRGIRVEVSPRYLPDRSDPGRRYWLFAYTVRITNEGAVPAQLLARHWVITDAHGAEEHVRGQGVIGEQPRIEPGRWHEYTSACPMRTSMGSMHGSYEMVTDDGDRFDAEIAPFVLADPLSMN